MPIADDSLSKLIEWVRPVMLRRYGYPSRRLVIGSGLVVFQWSPLNGYGGGAAVVGPLSAVVDMTTEQLREMIVSLLRKLSPEERDKSAPATLTDPELRACYPNLYEYLATMTYEDGTPRKASSLTLFVADGQIKAVLKDPDNNRSIWSSGDTMEAMLLALDAMLESPDAVWRIERSGPGDQAARIKKK